MAYKANPNTVKLIAKFYEIQDTQGTNAKKEILEKYKDDGAFTETLRWYFDNLIVTGLREKKIMNMAHKSSLWKNKVDIDEIRTWGMMDLLEYLNENNTGRDQDAAVVLAFAQEFGEETCVGILRIATKSWDSGLGIGRTTCNNVYGDNFLPTHEVMLCKNYFDDPDYFVDKRFIIQPKLDGFRMTAFKEKDKVTLLSRSGKDVTEKYPTIVKDIKDCFANLNVVIDGERMPLGFMEMSGAEQFKLVGESTKKGENNNVCLAVYDIVPLADWKNRKKTAPYSERYEYYTQNIKPKFNHLFPLPNLYNGKDVGQIKVWLEWARSNKKEGVIVKVWDASYDWDRSADCVKVKCFCDMDVKIVGFEEGKGKYKNHCGKIVFHYKGNEVRVGTGLNDFWRKEFWNNQKKYIGKTMEIVYQEECQNKDGKFSLRIPVYKCLKEGE